MLHYNYLIIGGGIAGVTAAETIRAHDSRGSIAIVSDEPHMLYSRVLLPSYIKKRISREKVFLRSIGDFEAKNIVVMSGERVVKIDSVRKEVFLASGRTVFFEKFCIASGGSVEPWSVAGAEKKGIFRLQTIDDADAILAALPEMREAIVVGGGFIALEFLDFFFIHQISTTLLCRNKNFFGTALDGDGIELIHANFEKHKINFMFGDEAKAILGNTVVEGIATKQDVKVSGDVIGLGIGLLRHMEFLEGSGIEKGEYGIKTNEELETNVSGIFAAGDVAEFYDTIVGKHHVHGNWTNAFLQGEIAGLNMVGQKKAFRKVPSYSLVNLGLHITFLGETHPSEAEETISRTDPVLHKYERFFIKEDRLIGAILINMFQDKPLIAKLVEERVSIAPFKEKLSKIDFDLHSVVV
ncbi:MAG: FAD-dependent oxidoreductase [bacterium]|nr:FAD-dependent oxidoreductase [bacterium]